MRPDPASESAQDSSSVALLARVAPAIFVLRWATSLLIVLWERIVAVIVMGLYLLNRK
jgi:hypothetical protein